MSLKSSTTGGAWILYIVGFISSFAVTFTDMIKLIMFLVMD